MKKLPVVAAIPTYNAEITLPPLLNQVLEQEYDQVYVLDDASTDNTLEAAAEFSPEVNIIGGKQNLGPGGNRNRIIGYLGRGTVLHFLDADVTLDSPDSPSIARELVGNTLVGYVGGMVRNPDKTQNPYNFGPRPSALNDISSGIQYLNWMIGNVSPTTARLLRKSVLRPYLRSRYPNIYEAPKPQEVFWASEANMVMLASVFEKMEGYDERFRYSEIFDYSIRLSKIGLKRFFNPALDVTHLSTDTAGNKTEGRAEAARQLREMYGNAQYILGAKAASFLKLEA